MLPTSHRASCDPMWQHLLEMAYVQASFSHDPRTQNGAVIVREETYGGATVLARGHNHVPFLEGTALNAVLADRDQRLARVVHAEVAAVADAAARGVKTEGLTLVCPWAACFGCASIILAAGIKRVVIHRQRMEVNRGPVAEALQWLADARVDLIVYDGEIGVQPILVNGGRWQP